MTLAWVMRCTGMGAWIRLLAVLWVSSTANAADLRVLCPGSLRGPIVELAQSFARTKGHRIEFVFASVGAIHKRAATGERADVVIGGPDGVAALARLGTAEGSSVAQIARAGLAVVSASGRPAHAVDSADEVVRVLRAAGAIAVPDAERGVPGAVEARGLIEGLQLADELRDKLRRIGSAAEATRLLAAGSIDLALLLMSDVAGMPGTAWSGPIRLPGGVTGAGYAAAVLRLAREPEAARAFIAHLKSAEAGPVLLRAGYLPAS